MQARQALAYTADRTKCFSATNQQSRNFLQKSVHIIKYREVLTQYQTPSESCPYMITDLITMLQFKLAFLTDTYLHSHAFTEVTVHRYLLTSNNG